MSARKSRSARSLAADHAPRGPGLTAPSPDHATRDPGVTKAAEAAEDLASERDRAAQDTRTLGGILRADLTAPGDHLAAIRRDLAQAGDLAQTRDHAAEVPERS